MIEGPIVLKCFHMFYFMYKQFAEAKIEELISLWWHSMPFFHLSLLVKNKHIVVCMLFGAIDLFIVYAPQRMTNKYRILYDH